MVTDSVRKAMSNDVATVATETIDVAWEQLKTSDAYWAGYSGMLIGGLVYSFILSLVVTGASYGMIGVVTLIGVTIGCEGLIGVIGALIFLMVRGVNRSLNWLLPSRYAAATAACLTGVVLFFVPLLVFGGTFEKGVDLRFLIFGSVTLATFLQVGAWLGADREIRRFQQRVAFTASGKVVSKKEYRFGIGRLLLCTFWLAGMMGILSWVGRQIKSPEGGVYFFVALFFTVFLTLGFSAILVGVIKVLRAIQKRLFYRKRFASGASIQARSASK